MYPRLCMTKHGHMYAEVLGPPGGLSVALSIFGPEVMTRPMHTVGRFSSARVSLATSGHYRVEFTAIGHKGGAFTNNGIGEPLDKSMVFIGWAEFDVDFGNDSPTLNLVRGCDAADPGEWPKHVPFPVSFPFSLSLQLTSHS